jgi:hypothetical protein
MKSAGMDKRSFMAAPALMQPSCAAEYSRRDERN